MTYVSKIGDFVWEDLNGNGIQDAGETGIAGVRVNLLNSSGNIVSYTTTGTDGSYAFANVRWGTYSFQFIAPTGYAFTLKDQGSNDAKDSDVNPTTGKTGTYTFSSTSANLTIDAGLYRIDTTAPTVSSVTYGTNDGALALGETVTLTVNFNEAVTVAGGTPTLALNTGGIATYTSGSGTSALRFTYTPAAGQNTSDLATAATALVLPAGTTIKDAAGNNAVQSGANNINPSGILAVDTTAPTVSSVTYGTNDGALALGETVTLTVNFNEAVTVAGGTPTLALNTGGIATYTSGSGTNTLTFTYTPAAGQNTADLTTAASALVLPAGTTIKDAAGNNAVLSGANNVNPSGILVVDTTAPTVFSVTYGTNDGALALGEVVTLTVNFSEAVTVANGTPTLALDTGGIATYTSGSGTNALTFTYTPAAGQNTADLTTAATALVLPAGATIKDAAGNNAVLSGANNVNPSGILAVDTTAPVAPTFALTSDSGTPGDGVTNAGTVNVTGLEVNATWEYSTNSGTNWTAGTGTSFTLTEGTYAPGAVRVIQTDLAGNTTITPSQNAGAIKVDTTAPTVSIGLQDSALTFGETTEVTFSFSEAVTSFDNSDLDSTNANGSLSTVTSANGGVTWTATFTPTVDINDPTNVITVGTGYTDLAGNTGAGEISPNYSINTLYSPVSINLSYAPSPLLTSYEATGSFPAVTYLFPEVSKTATKNSFVQRINLSVPTGGAPSAPVTSVTVTATNPLTFNGSAYVEIKYVWNDLNNNDQFDTGEQQFFATNQSVSLSSNQINQIIPGGQINAGSSVNLKAFSEINGDGTQLTQKLTFKLQDVDTSPGQNNDPTQQTDLGAATGELNFLLDQTRFTKAAGTTAAVINGFADSTLNVTVNGISQRQAATTLLGKGSLTEGPGSAAEANGTDPIHFLAQDKPITLDVEATVTTTTKSPIRRSDPVTVDNFQLVWAVPTDANFAAYAANSGSAAYNSPGAPLDSLVEFINTGYFSESLSQKQIFKDGQTVSGTYQEGTTTQSATAGNLGTANALTTAASFSGVNFEAYVNSLTNPANAKWKIPIASTVTQRVQWSNYSQAANPDVIVISLPTTVAGTKFKIGMGNGGGSLDLSKTTVLLANGDLAGADILGGNAKDFILGTRGDDLLTGANGKDTFAFGINSGNDTVIDFSGEKLDLTRIGITSANVISKLDTNGDGAINASVFNGVKDKYVVSGSVAPLKLDLSYFSDVASGLPGAVSNVNGPWNTTTTITLTEVSSLTASAFV